jgi:hypothetical protein
MMTDEDDDDRKIRETTKGDVKICVETSLRTATEMQRTK